MKHARPDYDLIQDPRGLIPEDEPVFLLRAQDVTAPDAVRYWAMRAGEAGALKNITDAAEEQAEAMVEWQREHEIKIPDMPLV
ncbi:unnamed protein product [marine sediment metagenome]|uniref:Uncharacterized protein n=1 Tax=marine sediment metagenome TaxID=412755 RepID=X1PSW9_9ZZZZ